jgi:hypothetical protein
VSIFESAHVVVVLSDYVSTDAKTDLIGAGFTVAGLLPTGLTGPQYITAMVDVPAADVGHEFVASVTLFDRTTGAVASFQGPSGEPEALRVQQSVRADRTAAPGLYLPDDMPGRVQLVYAFNNGLPLSVGHFYEWRFEIDGQWRPYWRAAFYVPGLPPAAVLGGPVRPGVPDDLPRFD